MTTVTYEARPPEEVTKEFLTVTEAAQLARVNEDTIRRWLRNGFVPGAKGGVATAEPDRDRRHWRIPRRALIERLSKMDDVLV